MHTTKQKTSTDKSRPEFQSRRKSTYYHKKKKSKKINGTRLIYCSIVLYAEDIGDI